MSNFKHWRLEREAGDAGVAWAILDTANSSTNTLGAEVMTELGLMLDECEKNPPRGLIFKSVKDAGFIPMRRNMLYERLGAPLHAW